MGKIFSLILVSVLGLVATAQAGAPGGQAGGRDPQMMTIAGASNEHRQARRPVAQVYDIIQKTAASKACSTGTLLNACVEADAQACGEKFNTSLTACIIADKKNHDNFMLTEAQQETLTSAMNSCAQHMTLTHQAAATTNKCLNEHKTLADKASYETRYAVALASDLEALKAKGEALKSGDKAVCPGYSGKFASGCFKRMLKTYRIVSVESASLLFDIGVQAAMKDKANGFDQRTASLMAADVGLFVMEHMKPATFTLSEMKPASLAEGVSRKILVASETLALENFKARAISSVDKVLDEQPSRGPASRTEWQDERETKLRLRLEKFEGRTLAIK